MSDEFVRLRIVPTTTDLELRRTRARTERIRIPMGENWLDVYYRAREANPQHEIFILRDNT